MITIKDNNGVNTIHLPTISNTNDNVPIGMLNESISYLYDELTNLNNIYLTNELWDDVQSYITNQLNEISDKINQMEND